MKFGLLIGGLAMMALGLNGTAHAGYDTNEALARLPFLAAEPGAAEVSIDGDSFTVRNAVMSQSWSVEHGSFSCQSLTDLLNKAEVELKADPFTVLLTDGTAVPASAMEIVSGPLVADLVTNPDATRLAERLPGKMVSLQLESRSGSLKVNWRAVLLDGSNYIRHELQLFPQTDLGIAEVVMQEGHAAELQSGGDCEGAPALAGNMFMGVEHPMSANEAGVEWRQVAAWDPDGMHYPDPAGSSWDLGSAVTGDGRYELKFWYTDGGYRLEVSWAALLQDGRELARDEHFGATGIAQIENTYAFDVAGYDPAGGPVELRAMTRADGGTDSTGIILLRDLQQTPRLRCSLPIDLEFMEGDSLEVSSVAGVAPKGQMRRAFAYYMERERAHPYRTFLHYNSWYDLGFFNKYSEQDCLEVIDAYRSELVNKRGVAMQSFLFDDGWDDYDSLWEFHEGFPNGFTEVGKRADSIGAGAGVWLSPWGGYGDPRQRRLAASEGRGYETNDGGFALSGPNYYQRFREICLKMIHDYNVNQFKIDGLGRKTGRVPGSDFASDFDAAISLIAELRSTRNDVFVNLTTGTWPSPFWLRTADSIWRSGYDHSYAGVGSRREQWTTYRDGETYRNIAQASPLFPLNSLMLHGIIYAPQSGDLSTTTAEDFRYEVRSYFASGTQLQELYVSPQEMTDENWDDLAAAANWAARNAAVLTDSHWIGGNPYDLEVYGWAAWHTTGAALALRNPADVEQSITLHLGQALELPAYSGEEMLLKSPYADQRIQELACAVDGELTITLQPFEVLVFELPQ